MQSDDAATQSGDAEPEEPPSANGRRPRKPGRYSRLRYSVGRHPADLIRLAVAAGVVLGCLFIARTPGVNEVEIAVFREIQRLPDWSMKVWQVLTWFGWWPGIVAGAGLALYLGRVRMAVAVAWSGVVAWVLVVVIHALIGPRAVPVGLLDEVVRGPGAAGFEFPSLHVAIIAAVVTGAGPYVTRVERDLSWALVVAVAVADLFLGTHLPLDVFAGAVLGWGVGTLMHIVLGAPGRYTSEPYVELAMRQAGLVPVKVTHTGRDLFKPQLYEVVSADGDRLQMKVVRRLHRQAGPGYKMQRMLASVEVENEPGLSTPRHEVEHEAYITLLAERAGVGTLPVLLSGEIEHGPPFLIHEVVDGRPLSTLVPGEITDAMLEEIWQDVDALGSVRIAHHDLRAKNILVDTSGHIRITDFTFSRIGGPFGPNCQDVAEVLVTLASVVGVDRAVDSATRALEPETLRGALPNLQTLALHRQFRRQLAGKAELASLREALAERLGCGVPPFRSPVRPATLAILVAGGFAVYLLLPELSSIANVRAVIAGADWWLMAATFVCGMLAIVASSWTILGSARDPLPVGKTVAVQVAAAFTGRTTMAALGYYAINLSFLERLGLRRTAAVGVLILNRAATVVVTGVATIIGILVIGGAVPIGQISIPWWAWPILAAIVIGIVAFLLSPYGRARVWKPLARSTAQLWATMLPTLRKPVRGMQLIGGEVLFLAFSAIGLLTTLSAFGAHYPPVATVAVFVVASTVGQLLPTPGGLGAVEGALVAGLTAIGIDPADAVAAALTARVLTFWLPVLPGIAAFRLLQHHEVV